MLERLIAGLRRERMRVAFAPGHFYSPVVDPAAATLDRARIWQAHPHQPGIDLDLAAQRARLLGWRGIAGRYGQLLRDDALRFAPGNDQFSGLDAVALLGMLDAYRPRRVVEIGSGFSTLLMLDAKAHFGLPELAVTCIEPYPRPFLVELGAAVELVTRRAETLDDGIVDRLEAGDVLFVDSSHVAKTGSDVNHIVFRLLPRLRPGVLVHFHDIFIPDEYPQAWVLDENRSWNEQYVLLAFLMFNDAFSIEFASHFVARGAPAEVAEIEASSGCALRQSAGSFWIRRRS